MKSVMATWDGLFSAQIKCVTLSSSVCLCKAQTKNHIRLRFDECLHRNQWIDDHHNLQQIREGNADGQDSKKKILLLKIYLIY